METARIGMKRSYILTRSLRVLSNPSNINDSFKLLHLFLLTFSVCTINVNFCLKNIFENKKRDSLKLTLHVFWLIYHHDLNVDYIFLKIIYRKEYEGAERFSTKPRRDSKTNFDVS